MPKGKKQCPKCNTYVACRTSTCKDCGHIFKKKKKKQAKPHFQERKDFVKRMLDGEKSNNWTLDMIAATKVFDRFCDHLDFLTKVKPPFKLKGSISYMMTKDGLSYLNKKLLEYNYKPEFKEEIKDSGKKVGEDSQIKKKKTLRDFLDNE